MTQSSNVLAAVLKHMRLCRNCISMLLSRPHSLRFTPFQSQAPPLVPTLFPAPNTLLFPRVPSAVSFNSVFSFWSCKASSSLICDWKHSIIETSGLFHFSIRIKIFILAHSVNTHFWMCVTHMLIVQSHAIFCLDISY